MFILNKSVNNLIKLLIICQTNSVVTSQHEKQKPTDNEFNESKPNNVFNVDTHQITNDKDYAAALISNCGYEYQIHQNIQTQDGYLLTMQRILPKTKEYTNENRKQQVPVLLMHGLLGSAEHFLLLNCTQSMPYQLVEQGYDVWLGNVRTVSYSRHHVTLNPDSVDFWKITFDDFGTYDLPALIDYILSTTQLQQLMYIGHSQGNMIYYIMCSNKPEYCDKVQLFVNLSPVATLKNFPHPWVTTICSRVNTLQYMVDRFGLHEWTLGRNLIREYGSMACGLMMGVCKYVVYLFSGLPPSRLSTEQFHRLLTNCPEGIAAKQFIHGCHMINDQSFDKFNYGVEENMIKYGTEDPPKYNLSMTTTPTAIYYCNNDWFLSDHEVRGFIKQIPNLVDLYEVTVDNFSHFDFIIGDLAPKYVYPRIINLMNKFRNMQQQQHQRQKIFSVDKEINYS